MYQNLTIKEEAQIYLAYGKQSPESLNLAIRSLGADIIFCSDTARMAGATLAAGTAQALYDLRQRLKPSAIAQQKLLTPSLSEAENGWLSHGQRSLAADSIFQFLTGMPLIQEWLMQSYPFHPKTVEDMKKCLLLLETVPTLRQPFRLKMASASGAIASASTRKAATSSSTASRFRARRSGTRRERWRNAPEVTPG